MKTSSQRGSTFFQKSFCIAESRTSRWTHHSWARAALTADIVSSEARDTTWRLGLFVVSSEARDTTWRLGLFVVVVRRREGAEGLGENFLTEGLNFVSSEARDTTWRLGLFVVVW